MIALVDYGAGNLTSVRKALTAIGTTFWTPVSPVDLARASGIVVPGVGHFSRTARLDAEWRRGIRAALDRSVPLLGICVGQQWLFDGSTEAGSLAVANALIPARCDLFLDVPAGDAFTAIGDEFESGAPDLALLGDAVEVLTSCDTSVAPPS